MSNRVNTINKKIVGGEDTILHSGAKRRLTITLFSLSHFYMSEGEGGDYKTRWSEKKEKLRKLRWVGDRLIMLCLLSTPFIGIKTKINHHHPLYFLTFTEFERAGTVVGRITDPWSLDANPCEYAAIHGKRDFASVVQGLELGRLSWNISEWDSVIIRVSIRGRQDGQS